jgi:hypothetical protein
MKLNLRGVCYGAYEVKVFRGLCAWWSEWYKYSRVMENVVAEHILEPCLPALFRQKSISIENARRAGSAVELIGIGRKDNFAPVAHDFPAERPTRTCTYLDD